jgi:hypothetical protein
VAFRRKKKPKRDEEAWFAGLLVGQREPDGVRLVRLEHRRQEIVNSAEHNPRFAGGLLADEIEKLHDIVEAFAGVLRATGQWERHLATVDMDELESDMRRHESDATRAVDSAQRDLARQNLAILTERQTQLAELRKGLHRARAELDLMENSLKLIADKVLVMASPDGVVRELDDLLVGVEAVREMTEKGAS